MRENPLAPSSGLSTKWHIKNHDKLDKMKRFLLTIAAAFFAQTAAAENITYVCKMTKQDSHGWIAPEYAFKVDPESDSAKVADRPEWIETRFKNRGSKGYRMVWHKNARLSAGGNARVRYQAYLNPKGNVVKVRMSFANMNAANKPHGVGTCRVES
ncbi:hypothetical protein SAMN05444358_101322 [Ruegeria halocynthiae]|uniref:Uncharacterized protein n=1 Tax=Ruegeria halocynthiae TaxID=985054 RepID=A0A1H2S220_9RHOB|nr:hypothetical protein [Ruegeria halocynthiae]SDW25154.1 hypothetical protein SAMN05444358_101322 [Ruegeria halocynthiae]